MNSSRANHQAGAFTLVELLCVIAIISILTALLLAAVNQAQSRGRRIGCVSHLQQIGIAFQLFMHDHDGRFPMAVPLAEGGSLEFVRNGFAIGGEFYFSYRHFQALSNELGLAKMLVCPTDTRLPAADFAVLQNSNISYFVGARAEISKPESILAGDRNLTANSSPNPSLLHGAADNRMWWTWELHQFKGNVLFADGHVEEWNNAALAAAAGNQLAGVDLVMPTVPFVPGAPVPAPAGYPHDSGANPGAESPPPAAMPPGWPENDSPGGQGRSTISRPGAQSLTEAARTNPTNSLSPNAPGGGTVTPKVKDPAASTFDQRLVIILRRVIIGFYFLILLILLLGYLYARWQKSHRKEMAGETGP